MRPTNPQRALTPAALLALIVVVGCTIEVNINTKPDDEPALGIVTDAPDAQPAPEAPRPEVRVPPPPVAARPPVRPAPRPHVGEPPADGVVRDALLRYREDRWTRNDPPAPGVDVPGPVDPGQGPSFTPFTVAPSISNRSEVVGAMQAAYPPLMRDAGIGGTVRVYFFIGADGRTRDVRIDEGSGNPALDEAALSVANVFRFTPALNRGETVPVWVSFPITFQP